VKEGFVIALAVSGLLFSLSGVVGIIRMPDVYTRIQCSSKTVTMGAIPALIALVIAEGPISNYGGRALLVAFLLLVVNPLSSHALARATYKRRIPMWRGSVVDQPAGRRVAAGEPADEG
jgi:multicomponent Na+:H+ antiporter subunit G